MAAAVVAAVAAAVAAVATLVIRLLVPWYAVVGLTKRESAPSKDNPDVPGIRVWPERPRVLPFARGWRGGTPGKVYSGLNRSAKG